MYGEWAVPGIWNKIFVTWWRKNNALLIEDLANVDHRQAIDNLHPKEALLLPQGCCATSS